MNIYQFFQKVWNNLKARVTPATLIGEALDLIVTPDVLEKIKTLVIAASTRNISGADKKELVTKLLAETKGSLAANLQAAGGKMISRAIDLVVTQLKLQNII